MIKTYDKYFIILFCKKLLLIFLMFFSLTFILTIFEEITFFSETQSKFYLPFLIALMDVPTTILEIFPFILLISTQLFFLEIIKKKETRVKQKHWKLLLKYSAYSMLGLPIIT